MIKNNQAVNFTFLFTLAIVAIVVFYPAIVILVEKWQASEDYAHAFFVIPIIGYMIWTKRDALEREIEGSSAGLGLLIFSILSYLLALKIQIPTLIFLTMVSVIVSSLIYLSGVRALKDLAIPILLLILVIPIPNQVLSMVTASLQLWVSDISSYLVRLLSVPIYQEGNILHIPDRSFQVVDACSGIRSLISMTTLSLIISYFSLFSKTGYILLFIISIPVAIVINLIRVVSMVLAYHFFKLDLTAGALHTISGLLLFSIGLLLLFTFQKILELWETRKINT